MAKRRTRKEKAQAKHTYLPEYTLPIQGQVITKTGSNTTVLAASENLLRVSLDSDTILIKKDILKSVIISGMILASELIIYFVWIKH